MTAAQHLGDVCHPIGMPGWAARRRIDRVDGEEAQRFGAAPARAAYR